MSKTHRMKTATRSRRLSTKDRSSIWMNSTLSLTHWTHRSTSLTRWLTTSITTSTCPTRHPMSTPSDLAASELKSHCSKQPHSITQSLLYNKPYEHYEWQKMYSFLESLSCSNQLD